MFLPSLWPYDDNTKVAVALVEGEGTGVFLMNLHIVDLSRMQEILYESPVSYLDSHLESQIDDGIVTLRFPDQTVTLDMRESDPDNLFEQAGYGGIVKYYLEGDTLYADVLVTTLPAPITAPLPTVTPAQMTTLLPIHTLLSIVTFLQYISPWGRAI